MTRPVAIFSTTVVPSANLGLLHQSFILQRQIRMSGTDSGRCCYVNQLIYASLAKSRGPDLLLLAVRMAVYRGPEFVGFTPSHDI